MKKLIAGLVTGLCLCLPGIASAHTGSVTCGETGVVFSYNADFPIDANVTETVNGVSKQITVKAHTALTDTIVATSDHVTALATWVGGGTIPPTNLVCPNSVPPFCQGVTETKTVYTPGPAVVQYVPYEVDVPGLTLTVTKYKTRIKWKTRIKLIRYTPVKPIKRPVPSGVAG